MRSFIILTISFLSLHTVSAQVDTEYIDFLYKEIRMHQPYGTIYYAERPHKEIAQASFNNLNKRTFKSFDKSIPDTVLTLTLQEQQYLVAELKKAVAARLPDNIFPDSKSTKPDSLVPIVDRVNKMIYDSLKNITDSAQRTNARNKNLLHWVFAFTNPIYIRNKTIFLHYFMYYRNNGGSEDLVFYKKRNNKWTRWIYIGGGAW